MKRFHVHLRAILWPDDTVAAGARRHARLLARVIFEDLVVATVHLLSRQLLLIRRHYTYDFHGLDRFQRARLGRFRHCRRSRCCWATSSLSAVLFIATGRVAMPALFLPGGSSSKTRPFHRLRTGAQTRGCIRRNFNGQRLKTDAQWFENLKNQKRERPKYKEKL